jgi:hypothetical protein
MFVESIFVQGCEVTNNFVNPLKTQVVVYHLIRCVAICVHYGPKYQVESFGNKAGTEQSITCLSRVSECSYIYFCNISLLRVYFAILSSLHNRDKMLCSREQLNEGHAQDTWSLLQILDITKYFGSVSISSLSRDWIGSSSSYIATHGQSASSSWYLSAPLGQMTWFEWQLLSFFFT